MIDQVAPNGLLRHLITLDGLDRQRIEQLLARARYYLAERGRQAPRDASLRGFTVANLFFEASTRTRASFELAAKRLDAEVLNLDVNTSSRAKGESILDTIYTLEAMHIDIFVVRDASSGVPEMIANAVAPDICVLNAGESHAAHPTQGLLDLLTIQLHKGDISDLRVAIVGDISHSRVARSAARALELFDVGELRFVGPTEFLPPADEFPNAKRFNELDSGIRDADVIMALRIQKERFEQVSSIPDSAEYFREFGLTEQRLRAAKADAIIMHPGPMNRGTEIDSKVADSAQSVIREQVANGVAVRMAVLVQVAEYIRAWRAANHGYA
jgi:aspartate carbamoyltransferase catalytic subunit